MLLTKAIHKAWIRVLKTHKIDEAFLGETKEVMYIPNDVLNDFLSELERHLSKEKGISREQLRKYRQATKKYREMTAKGEKIPDELLRLLAEFEAVPAKIDEVPNEIVEYVSVSPDRVIEFAQEREFANTNVRTMIVEYRDSLAPQAKQKNVCDFLLGSEEVGKYINETTGRFKAKEIHEDIQKELDISLETVKRFCQGFFSFHRTKNLPSL